MVGVVSRLLVKLKSAATTGARGIEWRAAAGTWKTRNTKSLPEPPCAPNERRSDERHRRVKPKDKRSNGEDEHYRWQSNRASQNSRPMAPSIVLPLARISFHHGLTI